MANIFNPSIKKTEAGRTDASLVYRVSLRKARDRVRPCLTVQNKEREKPKDGVWLTDEYMLIN